MKVDVRFFASLREAAGTDQLAVELSTGADFAALCAALSEQLGQAAMGTLRAESVRVALNQTLVVPPFVLRDGDEVAFLPPVTGG